MRKKLTKSEKDMAQKIADAIGWLDKLVFPGNPVKKITVITRRPKNPRVYVYYIPSENTEDGVDHYQIYGYGLDKYIKKEMEAIRVILIYDDGAERISWENLPKISEHELLIGYAAHEVRHRIQEHFKIELFSPNPKNIDSCYIRRVKKFLKRLFEETTPEGDYEFEFDAKAIEYIVREIWHWGERDLSKIASVIKAGANELESIINQMEVFK